MGASEQWTIASERHPKPHARYLVQRAGAMFVATPCYGLHAPWWVAMTARGEVPPEPIEPTDQWRELPDAPK